VVAAGNIDRSRRGQHQRGTNWHEHHEPRAPQRPLEGRGGGGSPAPVPSPGSVTPGSFAANGRVRLTCQPARAEREAAAS